MPRGRDLAHAPGRGGSRSRRLAQLAAPGAAVAALLPCYSDPADEADAAAVAAHFSMNTVRIDLSSAYDAMTVEAQTAMRALSVAARPAALPARRASG